MSKRIDIALFVIKVFSWLIFIGLCIETGALFSNLLLTYFVNPKISLDFWGHRNLYALYSFSQGHYLTLTGLLFFSSLLKSFLFYWILRIFHQKKLDFNAPFNDLMGRFIFQLAYISLALGLINYLGAQYCHYLVNLESIKIEFQSFGFEGSDIWFFMGIIFLIFALFFKKGIEIQNENDLTV
jgi:hypothetical protein